MKKHFVLTCLLAIASIANAQVADTSTLYKNLKAMDSLLFEQGFNKCNIAVYDSIIFDDLEFYHDKGGITKGKAAFIASVKNNICGSKNKVKRVLDKESLLVYPLHDNKILYGAIQQGIHSFYILENEQWRKGSTAKFTHLWLFDNGNWKLKRVLSYDH